MLASITPLGQRGRGSSWGATVLCFALACVATATGLGALLGAAGAILLAGAGGPWRLGVLGLVCLLGLMLDARVAGLTLPTCRRQVNEDWLRRYRGWVTGVGFGGQLGTGLVTIVNSSTVYVTLVAAALTRSALTGALVSACFGLTRAVTLLGAARVRSPRDLLSLHERLSRWGPRGRLWAMSAQTAMVVALGVSWTWG